MDRKPSVQMFRLRREQDADSVLKEFSDCAPDLADRCLHQRMWSVPSTQQVVGKIQAAEQLDRSAAHHLAQLPGFALDPKFSQVTEKHLPVERLHLAVRTLELSQNPQLCASSNGYSVSFKIPPHLIHS